MAYDVAALVKIVASSLNESTASASKMAASGLKDASVAATKATLKSAGVVVDDTAAMPQHVVGLTPAREMPVVWAIAKGSLLNKALLIPAALVASAFAPAVIPVAMAIG